MRRSAVAVALSSLLILQITTINLQSVSANPGYNFSIISFDIDRSDTRTYDPGERVWPQVTVRNTGDQTIGEYRIEATVTIFAPDESVAHTEQQWNINSISPGASRILTGDGWNIPNDASGGSYDITVSVLLKDGGITKTSDRSNAFSVHASPSQEEYTVALRSTSNDGSLGDEGDIWIEGEGNEDYGGEVFLEEGEYDIVTDTSMTYYDSRYCFDEWDTSGGVDVLDIRESATTMTVDGDGTLEAVYGKETVSIDVPSSVEAKAGDSALVDITVERLTEAHGHCPLTVRVDASRQPSDWSFGGQHSFDFDADFSKTEFSDSVRFELPDDASGEYEVTLTAVIADAQSVVFDSETVIIIVEPQSAEKPDLRITDISWSPSDPNVGDEVVFSYTEKNYGEGKAGSHRVTLWIDEQVISNDHVSLLDAGDSITRTFEGAWTAKAGSHEIRVMTDSNDDLQESNDENNDRTEEITVFSPSLIETDIELDVCPEKDDGGWDCSLDEVPADTDVRIILQGILTREDNGNGLVGKDILLEWPGGSEYVETGSDGRFSYSREINLGVGDYSFTASYGGDSEFEDSQYSKNLMYKGAEGFSDASLTSLNTDSDAYSPSDTVSIAFRVRNAGNTDLQLRLAIEISDSNGNIVYDSNKKGEDIHLSLEKGVEGAGQFVWKLPQSSLPGKYRADAFLIDLKDRSKIHDKLSASFSVIESDSESSQTDDISTDEAEQEEAAPDIIVTFRPQWIDTPFTPGGSTLSSKTQFVHGEYLEFEVDVSNIGGTIAKNVVIRLQILDGNGNYNFLNERSFRSIEAGKTETIKWQTKIEGEAFGQIVAAVTYHDEKGDSYAKDVSPSLLSGFQPIVVVPKTFIVFGSEEASNTSSVAYIDGLAGFIWQYTGNEPDVVRDIDFYEDESRWGQFFSFFHQLWTWITGSPDRPLSKTDYNLILVGSPSSNKLVYEMFPELELNDQPGNSDIIIKIDEDLGVAGDFVFITAPNPYRSDRRVTVISAPNHASLEFLIDNLLIPSLKTNPGYDLEQAFIRMLSSQEESFDRPVRLYDVLSEYVSPFYACKIGDRGWCLFEVGALSIPVEGAPLVAKLVGKIGSTAAKVVVKSSGNWVAREAIESTVEQTLKLKGFSEQELKTLTSSLSKLNRVSELDLVPALIDRGFVKASILSLTNKEIRPSDLGKVLTNKGVTEKGERTVVDWINKVADNDGVEDLLRKIRNDPADTGLVFNLERGADYVSQGKKVVFECPDLKIDLCIPTEGVYIQLTRYSNILNEQVLADRISGKLVFPKEGTRIIEIDARAKGASFDSTNNYLDNFLLRNDQWYNRFETLRILIPDGVIESSYPSLLK